MTTQVLSVALPSEVIYVSGTVNGTAYTWTLIDGAWTATVERAADDTYNVVLTAVTAAGTSASYDLTLYYGLLSLITDRTQNDVNRVKKLTAKDWASMTDSEKAEWRSGMKGAYNAADLNRVDGAVNYLCGRLTQLPIDIQDYLDRKSVAPDKLFSVPYNPEDFDFSAKVTWQVEDTPTEVEMQSYLGNVVLLRSAFDYDTDQLPKSMVKLTFAGANAIEKALVLLDAKISDWKSETENLVDNTAKSWFYSDEIYSGEI